MFRDTPSYSENGDAHRLRSINITPPAMTWHTAFWIPQYSDDNYDDIDEFKKSANRSKIEGSLDSIFSAITIGIRKKLSQNVTLRPFVNDVIVLFDSYIDRETLLPIKDIDSNPRYAEMLPILKSIKESDHRSIIVEFRWLDYWVTMRCSLQTEYFTIVVIAETARGCEAEKKRIGSINFFSKAFDHQIQFDETGQSLDCHLDDLFDGFWSQFNKFIRGLENVNDLMPKEMFEQIYADARGFVTDDFYRHEKESDKISRFASDDPVGRWAYSSIERYKGQITTNNRYECTASFMLDRRAVYMTALGPQNPDRKPNSRNPLTYIIFVKNDSPNLKEHVNKWQLGRLVDRIHFLGRTRLAALRHVKILRAVSAELSRIDKKIAEARRDVERYGSNDNLRQINVSNIEKLHRRMNFISDNFLNLTSENSMSGILYRIERSRYYVDQFRKNIPQLRISRIEGYQQYDDFIEKRLGGVFDSIDRIGVRYERALRAMAAIDQNYLAAQSHDLAARSHKTSSSIEEIQKWGELFLISVLVPYYLLGIFKLLVEYRIGYGPNMLAVGVALLSLIAIGGMAKFVQTERYSYKSIRIMAFGTVFLFAIILVSLIQEEIKH